MSSPLDKNLPNEERTKVYFFRGLDEDRWSFIGASNSIPLFYGLAKLPQNTDGNFRVGTVAGELSLVGRVAMGDGCHWWWQTSNSIDKAKKIPSFDVRVNYGREIPNGVALDLMGCFTDGTQLLALWRDKGGPIAWTIETKGAAVARQKVIDRDWSQDDWVRENVGWAETFVRECARKSLIL